MSKGSTIVINGNEPKGRCVEGIITDTSKPGMAMEIVPGVEPVNGRFSFRAMSTQGANKCYHILLEDDLQGCDVNAAYVANTQGRLYVPVPGDELNLLFANISGTGDTFAIGDPMIVNNAGKFIDTAGSPAATHVTCAETVGTALTADTLVACVWH